MNLNHIRDWLFSKIRVRLANTEGAIDLASIMVGVLVVGVIGGVIGATVFSVIPWSQDGAAKANLQSVRTAESVARVKDGHHMNSAELAQAKYLLPTDGVKVATDSGGKCFVGISRSATGALFYTTNEMATELPLTKTATLKCITVSALDDLVASAGGWGSSSKPFIAAGSLPHAIQGYRYATALTFTSDTPVTFTITDGALPDGLAIDASTGEIAGTSSLIGVATFTVHAENRYGSSSRVMTLETNQPAPKLTTSSLPDGSRGDSYSFVLTSSGSENSYSVTSGSLPAGIVISSDGTISGTPSNVGDSTFEITVTNSGGAVTKSLTLSVMPVAAGVTIARDVFCQCGADDGLADPWSLSGFMPNTWSAAQSEWARWMISSGNANLTGTAPEDPNTPDYSTSINDNLETYGNYNTYEVKLSSARYAGVNDASKQFAIAVRDQRFDIVMSSDGQTLIGFLKFTRDSSYAATNGLMPSPSFFEVVTKSGQIVRTDTPAN